MIEFNQFQLSNGLRVYVHEDQDTQVAVLNVLYNVGSRDEDENKTGFAHLFEHLMFGGSKNVPSYDEPLQAVGGENNAFTSPDITNYYLTLPANNLETGFWLESDRMMSLSFDPKVLEVQRKVVIEEFKQRYLNQPYGDEWLKLRPLAYKTHPYKWATIGKDISHIEDATMNDVKSFFNKFYNPSNAILVVAGKVRTSEIEVLAKKWFGPIDPGPIYHRSLPKEPIQTEGRLLEHEDDVPLDSLTKVYHMEGRLEDRYYASDLAGDILGRGKSSKFYQKLVKGKSIFSTLDTYITGSIDPGLLIISGKLNPKVTIEEGDNAIQHIIEEFIENGCTDEELKKVKNQAESTIVFSEVELLNKAMNIAFGANMGNPNLINEEKDKIAVVDHKLILESAKNILRPENCSTLYYRSNNNKN
ncbi:MAG: insulinase family protein [Saprospiraceae bacterium]|nr:insulinase family protein [Saprospiraceae bacterium]